MKTATAIIFLFALSFNLLNAQLKVSSTGNVGIGLTTDPTQKLELGGSIKGNQAGGSLRITTNFGSVDIGARNEGCIHFISSLATGTYYYFDRSLLLSNGKIFSYSTADLTLWVANYPRLTISNSTGNVGIGLTPGSVHKLDVAGTIASYGTPLSSDIRLKHNVKSVEKETINKLSLLSSVSYQYSKDAIEKREGKKSGDSLIYTEHNDDFYNKIHYGYSAQEFQKVFPDLVYTDDDGYLTIDYVGLIPLLVETVKEQQIQIDNLINNRGSLKSTSEQISSPLEENNILEKNVPNPFNLNTTINYYLSSSVQKAVFYIYDLQGKQIKSIAVQQRGNGQIIIQASELTPGIYYYTLIADGKEVGMEKMILTN